MFEEMSETEMIQADFWNLYKKAVSDHGIDGSLSATKLMRLVTTTFPQAYSKVVPGTRPKYLIIGLQRRRTGIDTRTNVLSSQTNVEEAPFAKPFETILKRVLDFDMTVQYSTACLVPLIRACIKELRSLNMNWPPQPLADFVSSVMYDMAKQVGPKPLTPLKLGSLAKLGRGCMVCSDLRQFIISDSPTLPIRAGPGIRQHIELQLRTRAQEWGLPYKIINTGFGHILEVRPVQRFSREISYGTTRSQSLKYSVTKRHGQKEGKGYWPR